MKTIALDESIMQKGQPATAGSKILENFTAPFDATVVTRLTESGYAIAFRAAMNEFGIGNIGADQPYNISGAVKAVADGAAEFALCNDIFGTYRRYAAEQGLCYIRPTYGTVSRFGLIPLAASMDQIGVVCKNLRDGFNILSHIAGNDERDGAMLPDKIYSYGKSGKKLTVCAPESIVNKAGDGMQEGIRSFVGHFDSTNVELKHFDLYKQVMYILSCAEISNNLSRYDGVKFGYRADGFKGLNDLYLRTRTEGLGLNAKLASVMGAVVLSQDKYVPVYEKAMKLRRLIKDSLRFDEYDVIILPTKISDNPYENLALYALPALAGLPCVSFSHNGYGIQLIANSRDENALITAWGGGMRA